MTTPRTHTWWQLSFADDSGFLGGFATQAQSFWMALARASIFGANPGGEVQGFGYTAEAVDPAYLDRLLTSDEVENMPEPTGFVDYLHEESRDSTY